MMGDIQMQQPPRPQSARSKAIQAKQDAKRSFVLYDTSRIGTANAALLGGMTGLPTLPGMSPPVRSTRKVIDRTPK